MTQKRKTRDQLEAELADVHHAFQGMRAERDAAAHHAEDLRKKLDDVKERLARAESENQRMRGYLERVQEDDVVREELIAVGEPGGEQQLCPKRKPTIFAPQIYTAREADRVMAFENGRNSTKPKHWVTY